MKLIKTLKLFKSRRAMNSVVSNMILIGAVIAVGFAMLGWSQSQSAIYNNQYSNAVASDAEQLRERVVFEYLHYDSTGLKVYLMNSGTVGGVTIANVYVDNISYGPQKLYLLNNTPISSLNVTQQGNFTISPPPSLTLGKNDHPIIIVTGRGSSFAATFAT